jgi:hypothetical protein
VVISSFLFAPFLGSLLCVYAKAEKIRILTSPGTSAVDRREKMREVGGERFKHTWDEIVFLGNT